MPAAPEAKADDAKPVGPVSAAPTPTPAAPAVPAAATPATIANAGSVPTPVAPNPAPAAAPVPAAAGPTAQAPANAAPAPSVPAPSTPAVVVPAVVGPAAGPAAPAVAPAASPPAATPPATPRHAPAAQAPARPANAHPARAEEPKAPAPRPTPAAQAPASPPAAPAAHVRAEEPAPAPQVKAEEPRAPVAIALPAEPFARALATRLERGTIAAIGSARVRGERLTAFYAGRGYAPIWFDARGQGPLLKRAEEVRQVLMTADHEGLDPAVYHVGEINERWQAQTAAQKAELDLLLTDAVMAYARHLRSGRIDPQSLASEFWFSPPGIDGAAAVNAIVSAPVLQEELAKRAPPAALYAGLREMLARYRAIEAAGGWRSVPGGQKLTPGMQDRAIKAVRARLRATGELDAKLPITDLYDQPLKRAVERFQQRHGLTADGVIGAGTIDEMNVRVGERIQAIRTNMERMRWLDKDLGDRYVLVNIPGFDLNVVEDQRTILSMPVIVGTAKRHTPLFSSEITTVVFNPTWTVPVTLAKEDFLPKLRRDPNYLASRNIRLYSSWQSGASEINPAAIDWNNIGQGTIAGFRLRQAPGDHNSLGRIKFDIRNPFAVYLHDTPDQKKFQAPVRAFSSGCVRVSDPMGLAQVVFADMQSYPEEKRQQMIASGQTKYVPLNRPLPVHLLYLTAWQDDRGIPQFRRDIYGWDQHMQRSLAGSGAPPATGS